MASVTLGEWHSVVLQISFTAVYSKNLKDLTIRDFSKTIPNEQQHHSYLLLTVSKFLFYFYFYLSCWLVHA